MIDFLWEIAIVKLCSHMPKTVFSISKSLVYRFPIDDFKFIVIYMAIKQQITQCTENLIIVSCAKFYSDTHCFLNKMLGRALDLPA